MTDGFTTVMRSALESAGFRIDPYNVQSDECYVINAGEENMITVHQNHEASDETFMVIAGLPGRIVFESDDMIETLGLTLKAAMMLLAGVD